MRVETRLIRSIRTHSRRYLITQIYRVYIQETYSSYFDIIEREGNILPSQRYAYNNRVLFLFFFFFNNKKTALLLRNQNKKCIFFSFLIEELRYSDNAYYSFLFFFFVHFSVLLFAEVIPFCK